MKPLSCALVLAAVLGAVAACSDEPSTTATTVADAGEGGAHGSVDTSKLGKVCGATASDSCPTGMACYDFRAFDTSLQDPRCAPEPPCAIVTCPGSSCRVLTSAPAQVVCR